MIFRLSLLAFVVASLATSTFAEDADEGAKSLAVIRTALAGRQLADIAPALEKAKAIKGSIAFEEERNRVELLANYVTDFWKAVDQGARSAVAMGELTVGESLISIVEYDRKLFVIRHEGQNKRYTVETIPAKLALTVAQLKLSPESAANKVYFGAFLAMDGKGDRKIARRYWDEAAAAGVDVKFLLPELETARARGPIEIPEVSPASRVLLNPNQWQVRKRVGTRVQRDPLGKLGKLNSEGRLEIHAIDGDEVAIVSKTRFTGDFQTRCFLQGVGKDQKFGLFPAAASDAPVLVDLPEGTVKIELLRKQGVYYCKINDDDVELKPSENAGKQPGFVGFTFSGPIVVALMELSGK